MKPTTFRVTDDIGDGLWMFVTIYPDRDSMHRAYRRWEWADTDAPAMEGGWQGLCAYRDIVQVLPDGTERENPYLGRIFLHRGALGTQVVAHEVVHAALGFSRRRNRTRRVVIAGMEAEERFCHTVSDLNRAMVQAMYDRKMYDDLVEEAV